jgi:type I restriction-modification system DNA methylase subunit
LSIFAIPTQLNVPDDQLGDAYECLIKEFANDSGRCCPGFIPAIAVSKLMTMIMDPQPGEVSMILWFWWFVVGALCISEKERNHYT